MTTTTEIKKVYGIREWSTVEGGKLIFHKKYYFTPDFDVKNSKWDRSYPYSAFVKGELRDLDRFGVSDVKWIECGSPEEEAAKESAAAAEAATKAAEKESADPMVFYNPYSGEVYNTWEEVVANYGEGNFDFRKIRKSMIEDDVEFE